MNASIDPVSGKNQRGQMLVIFAGALLLIMAISALVVDLGFVFMLRRQEQNAADPGAIAAARHIPTKDTGQMWSAACFYAVQNGFAARRSDTSADCPGGLPHDGSIVTVNYPPSPAAVEFAGDPGYVEVTVRRPHKSFFAGVLGMPTITVATSAVAAWDTNSGGMSSLVALREGDCTTAKDTAKIHGGSGGSGGVDIFPAAGVTEDEGGYVQINSACGIVMGADDACTAGSSSGMTISGGPYFRSNTVYIQGACTQSGGSATIVSPPTEFNEQAAYVGDPLALLRPPLHSDLTIRQCPGGGTPSTATSPKKCDLNGPVTLDPGTYYGGWKINSATTVTLNPGIYVIAGGGITQSAGTLDSVALGRVLIYSTDSPVCGIGGQPEVRCQGKLDFTANTTLDLRGLDKSAPCLPYGSTTCPYGGLLMWQDGKASGAGTAQANVELSGGGSLYLEGTIYSPKGHVKITGNGEATGCTVGGVTNCAAVQVIADTFDIGGGGILRMPYDPNLFYDLPLKGLVR